MNTKQTKHLGYLAAVLSGLALFGSAKATVQPQTERVISGLPAPTVVLVYRFAISADEVTENPGFFQRVQDAMSSTPLNDKQRQTAWSASNRLADDLVTGINGLGSSKIDTRMRVMYASGGIYRTLADIAAHSDSGEMPGAAVTMGAGAAAQGGATLGMALANAAISGGKVYESSLNPMIDRLANKSVTALSQLFAAQGWIPPSMIKSPSWKDL